MMIAWVASGEVGRQIANAIRQVMMAILEAATPIVDAIAVVMIISGALLAIGFRQEGYGIRLISGGVIALVFMHLVLPLLLQLF